MEIPDDKRLEYALQYIHGIGRARARQILSDLSLVNKHVKDLTKREVYVLGEELSKYAIGRELVKPSFSLFFPSTVSLIISGSVQT